MQRLAAESKSWFLTEKGVSFMRGAFTGGLTLGVMSQFLPHTFFSEQFVDVIHHYRAGVKTPISTKLQDKFQECLNLLKMEEFYKKHYSTYTVNGFDLYTVGSANLRQGAKIGIPLSFNYKSQNDIDKTDIMTEGRPVDWGSEEGEMLANSLILPDHVQKFGLCSEILWAKTYRLHLNWINLTWSGLIAYFLGAGTSRKLGLFEKPRYVRVCFYGLSTIASMGLYFLTKDSLHLYYERKVDMQLAKMGPEMIKSGIEYYNSIIQRNIALRTLLGESGRSQFSRHGNENYLFRQKKIPYTIRKEFFEKQLKELETNSA